MCEIKNALDGIISILDIIGGKKISDLEGKAIETIQNEAQKENI